MKHSPRFHHLALLLCVPLLLAACTSAEEQPETPEPTPTAILTTEPAEPVASEEPEEPIIPDGVNGEWVQDFWLYEQILTFDADGQTVDLTEEINAGLGEPTATFPLPHDAIFYVYEDLKPSITNQAGATRGDVDVVAGLLEFDGEHALAVLATPDPDAAEPIGLLDQVELDLTYLGEKLQPGDPLIVDFAFLQARPFSGEASASGVELFAQRLTNGSSYFMGEEVDGDVEVYALHQVLATAVPGSTRLQSPAKGSISDPGLDGMKKGWQKCLGKSPIKCVRGYFKSAADGASKSNDLIKCNLGNCNDPKPDPQPTPKPKNERPWCTFGCTINNDPPARVHGDPHLRSFDGFDSAMQGVGEYVLTTGPALDIHIRTVPINETSRTVSGVAMAAIRLGSSEIVVDVVENQIRLLAGNDELSYDVTENLVTEIERDGVTIFVEPHSVILASTEDEIGVEISHAFGNLLNISVHVPQDYLASGGLLGDYDGDRTNDLQARDGTILPLDSNIVDYYNIFANSWRLSDDESLLYYESGENTQTFTIPNFPDLSAPSPSETDFLRAQAVCEAAGITEPSLLEACAFDFAVSGEIGFVQSAQSQMMLLERILVISNLAQESSGGHSRSDEEGELTDPTVDPWSLTTTTYEAGAVLLHTCPPNGEFHTIWGGENGIYTNDSSICTAAVHAGLITQAQGGDLRVTTSDGLDDYGSGSEQNGVSARGWGSWHGSYTLEQR